MVTPIYIYSAKAIRVIDADTLLLDIDLGFSTHGHLTVRLRGVDAPEVRTPEGLAAKAAVEAWLLDRALVIQSYKGQQSFARWVVDVWIDGELLADRLRAAGHVKGENP